MAVKLADASMQAGCDAIVDRVDNGSANPGGALRIYSGAQGSEGDTEPSGQLVECQFANPAFSAATAGGVATATGSISGVATATATALSAALLDRDRNMICTLSVTATGGGGDVELSNTSITNGETIFINSFTFTLPQDQS